MSENREQGAPKTLRAQRQASFFKELGGFMKPYAAKYVGSVIVSVAGVAASVASYACAGLIAGSLFAQTRAGETLFGLALAAAACKVLSAALLNASTWISHKAAYLTLKDVREALSAKLLRLPLGYFERTGSGRLKTMLVDHVEGMEKTLAHLFPEMSANLLAPLALLAWMFFIDGRLALCVLAWTALGFLVAGGIMKGYAGKFAGQIAALKRMNQAVAEYAGGIEIIKNFGRADTCSRAYEDAVHGHAAYNVRWQKEGRLYASLGMAIAPFSLFPVLIAGLIFFDSRTLDAGTLFLSVIVSFGVFGPLMKASSYFDQLAGMGTNAQEIKDVLEHPELKRGSEEEPCAFDVVFKDVTFSYATHGVPALKHVSLSVPAGTMLALVGLSGSGKSTIAKLLAGYWDADAGGIYIGGKPLSAYSQEGLNRHIAYVDQETFLFDESILDNIRLGRPSATAADAMAAAKRAGCDDFIRALPHGYDTSAGMAGSMLSGGERQRIAIARAMVKQAPIMILDEATASSDPENEASIQQALSAAAQGTTLVVVAHRLSTIMHAQQIALVKDGAVQAVGTHAQLLENCRGYQALWALAGEE